MVRDKLFDQTYEEICIHESNAREMEAFLLRNNIPYKIKSKEQGKTVFSVRAGFDHRDSKIFVLKMWGDLSNPEVVNEINNLVIEQEFSEPKFEYETFGYNRC